MVAVLYSLLIWFYKVSTLFATSWSKKADARITGLHKQSVTKDATLKKHPCFLIHCASLGEYEQIRPVVDWVLGHKSHDIVISFFSSSGYNNVTFVDKRLSKLYLPFDLKKDMREFISAIDPQLVIITKNEWWWNLLSVLDELQIPTYQVSVTIRPQHYFLKFPLSFFRSRMRALRKIFVVNTSSAALLKSIYTGEIIIAGDTRKDQVMQIPPTVLKTDRESIMIYGSVWENDMEVVSGMIAARPDHRHLIYPHELSDENVNRIKLLLPRHSEIITSVSKSRDEGIYIVTSMGELKHDYHLASLIYVGGGFGAGIHNILEAAVTGVPTIIGPNFNKSEEAKDLITKGLLFSVSNAQDAEALLFSFSEAPQLRRIQMGLTEYFSIGASSTSIVCREIFETS